MPPAGTVAVVLSAHAPFVSPAATDAVAERGFFDALLDGLLPLVGRLRRLRDSRVEVRLTLAVSPTLGAMLRDAALADRFDRYVQAAPSGAAGERFDAARAVWDAVSHDLVAALADLEATGHVELAGGPATHAPLPLLEERSARAQLSIGAREHLRLFGHRPRGMWLPALAWAPGLDGALAAEGVRFVVVDALALEHATPRPLAGVHAPVFTPAGVAAFARDPVSSAALFDVPAAEPTPPRARALRLLAACRARAAALPEPLFVVAGELARLARAGAGGLAALEHLCSELATTRTDELRGATLAGVLERQSVLQRVAPCASRWPAEPAGDAARARTLRHVHHCARTLAALTRARPDARGAERRALAQAAREVLLLEASDTDLTRAFPEHLDSFRMLSEMIQAGAIEEPRLAALEARDALFRDLDPRVYA